MNSIFYASRLIFYFGNVSLPDISFWENAGPVVVLHALEDAVLFVNGTFRFRFDLLDFGPPDEPVVVEESGRPPEPLTSLPLFGWARRKGIF